VVHGTGQAVLGPNKNRDYLQFFQAVKRIKITKSCWEPIRTENTKAVVGDASDISN
jgi:hypothetical protein